MRDKPRKKLSFGGMAIIMDSYQEHGKKVRIADNLRAVLVGYYDASVEEINDLDADKAMDLFDAVQERFDVDTTRIADLQKKVNAPSASSPTADTPPST